MKKLLILFTLLLIMATACTELPPPKDYSCKEWSVECELQKDRILIQPIIFDSLVITDAYSYPVLTDSTHWYIVNTKLGVLAPINVRVILSCNNTSNGRDCTETNHPTVEQLLEKDWYENKGHFRVEEISLTGIVPGIKKAYIVVTGPNEILAISQEALLTKPKLPELAEK